MEVSFGSNCLSAPEAAFLVLLYSSKSNFLRSLLNSSNDDLGKYTSPLTSTISGVDLSNSMILVLKGRKSYEFDGDGYKPVHSTQIETSIYF